MPARVSSRGRWYMFFCCHVKNNPPPSQSECYWPVPRGIVKAVCNDIPVSNGPEVASPILYSRPVASLLWPGDNKPVPAFKLLLPISIFAPCFTICPALPAFLCRAGGDYSAHKRLGFRRQIQPPTAVRLRPPAFKEQIAFAGLLEPARRRAQVQRWPADINAE